jgi:hypothetical protein
MKDKLVFDTTSAGSIADSDSVGAFVRAADGALITSTVVGADTGLDVNVINASLVVTATDLDIRDLSAASDSVDSWLNDGSGNAITSTSGALDVNLKSPITVDVSLDHANDSVKIGDGTDFMAVNTNGSINAVVSATDLDIRDLAYATDSVTAYQGTSPWVVSATNLDIRDLTAASDSVDAWLSDGAGNAINSTSGSLNVNITNTLTVSDAALANVAVENEANDLAVADTAENICGAVLSNRKYLWIYNDCNRKVYIGKSGVTASNGFPISPGSYMELRAGAAVDLEFVGQSGSSGANAKVRTMQLS